MRLGIDVGTVRIGVARSDPQGILALPVETLHRADDGRWYLFGTVRPQQGANWGSSWDGLVIFTAERPEGPWRPLFSGPAKVDVATARPAGRMFQAAGAVIVIVIWNAARRRS